MAFISKRSLDIAWTAYLLLHLVPALLFDTQAFIPREHVPEFMKAALASWIQTSNDPILRNMQVPEFTWLKAFIGCELFFQTPIFIVGAYGLLKNDKRIWPLILLYGAHSATTTLACLATLITKRDELHPDQFTMLMSSYLPYFVVPVLMVIDMHRRINPYLGVLVKSKTN